MNKTRKKAIRLAIYGKYAGLDPINTSVHGYRALYEICEAILLALSREERRRAAAKGRKLIREGGGSRLLAGIWFRRLCQMRKGQHGQGPPTGCGKRFAKCTIVQRAHRFAQPVKPGGDCRSVAIGASNTPNLSECVMQVTSGCGPTRVRLRRESGIWVMLRVRGPSRLPKQTVLHLR